MSSQNTKKRAFSETSKDGDDGSARPDEQSASASEHDSNSNSHSNSGDANSADDADAVAFGEQLKDGATAAFAVPANERLLVGAWWSAQDTSLAMASADANAELDDSLSAVALPVVSGEWRAVGVRSADNEEEEEEEEEERDGEDEDEDEVERGRGKHVGVLLYHTGQVPDPTALLEATDEAGVAAAAGDSITPEAAAAASFVDFGRGFTYFDGCPRNDALADDDALKLDEEVLARSDLFDMQHSFASPVSKWRSAVVPLLRSADSLRPMPTSAVVQLADDAGICFNSDYEELALFAWKSSDEPANFKAILFGNDTMRFDLENWTDLNLDM